MLQLYTHGTPNGHKVTIALEELGLPYEIIAVNPFTPEGKSDTLLALNPAGKIPVLRDLEHDLVVSESNAILLYLADKSGRLVPTAPRARLRAIELLFLQASLQGPMFGQRSHFSLFAPEHVPYAIARYEAQGAAVDELVAKLLEDRAYLLGSDYSIVDIAFFGWYFAALHAGFALPDHPSLQGWYARVSARDAVARGVTIPSGLPELPPRKRL